MKIWITCYLLLSSCTVFAEEEISFGYGMGMDSTLIQSQSISNANQWEVAFSHNLKRPFENSFGHWQWWLQGGFIHLTGHQNNIREHLNIIEIKPVLRLFPGQGKHGFFLEGGLGLATLSRKQFETVTIQTRGNFAIHFATGWKWDSPLRLSLRYSHFSNGYTHTPNPGLDTLSLNLHWAFL